MILSAAMMLRYDLAQPKVRPFLLSLSPFLSSFLFLLFFNVITSPPPSSSPSVVITKHYVTSAIK
jgi:hypothetical protein